MRIMVLKKTFENIYRTLKVDDVKEAIDHVIDDYMEETGLIQVQCHPHNNYIIEETEEFITVTAEEYVIVFSGPFDEDEAEKMFNAIINSLTGDYGYMIPKGEPDFYQRKPLVDVSIYTRKKVTEDVQEGSFICYYDTPEGGLDLINTLRKSIKNYKRNYLPSTVHLQIDSVSDNTISITGFYYQKENTNSNTNKILTKDMRKLLWVIWNLYAYVDSRIPAHMDIRSEYKI